MAANNTTDQVLAIVAPPAERPDGVKHGLVPFELMLQFLKSSCVRRVCVSATIVGLTEVKKSYFVGELERRRSLVEKRKTEKGQDICCSIGVAEVKYGKTAQKRRLYDVYFHGLGYIGTDGLEYRLEV